MCVMIKGRMSHILLLLQIVVASFQSLIFKLVTEHLTNLNTVVIVTTLLTVLM